MAEKINGRILHFDGDRKYSEKSYKYYKKLGLNAVVKSIPEYKQPLFIKKYLKMYKPDVLVITGHDNIIHRNKGYFDISNYKNSKYFIESVKKAREYAGNGIAIFAGACQSFYEGIIMAGANFASSPKRILIDYTEPLIIASYIALTSEDVFINIEDIEKRLKNGTDGVGGIGTYGKKRSITFM